MREADNERSTTFSKGPKFVKKGPKSQTPLGNLIKTSLQYTIGP